MQIVREDYQSYLATLVGLSVDDIYLYGHLNPDNLNPHFWRDIIFIGWHVSKDGATVNDYTYLRHIMGIDISRFIEKLHGKEIIEGMKFVRPIYPGIKAHDNALDTLKAFLEESRLVQDIIWMMVYDARSSEIEAWLNDFPLTSWGDNITARTPMGALLQDKSLDETILKFVRVRKIKSYRDFYRVVYIEWVYPPHFVR